MWLELAKHFKNIEMSKIRHVHFIGIGGIGISAIAKMFLSKKVSVSGSDINNSALIEELKAQGVKIFLGHSAENILKESDLVIYTNAISGNNEELLRARKTGLKTLSYPEALGEISKDKFVIAISGNAGKTTTTAMVGQILIDAGLEPTIVVGSLANFVLKDGRVLRTNFVLGSGKYFVVEADEYKRAFLNLSPTILAINNIDEDHLDYYKDLSDIQDAFIELANKVSQDGFIVLSAKDKNLIAVSKNLHAKVIDYTETSISDYSLSVSGKHNRDNAKVATTIAILLGIDKETIGKSLANFKGAWRRFEYLGKTKNGALLYDDYAHNPQKIKAVISGTKESFPDKRIVIIFQPHLFSRTKQLLKELAQSFVGADRVIVTPIYAAREIFDPSITHLDLAKAISKLSFVKEVETVNSLDEVSSLTKTEGEGSICLTVGAGDIHTASRSILDKI